MTRPGGPDGPGRVVLRLARRYLWVVLAVGGAIAVLSLLPPH